MQSLEAVAPLQIGDAVRYSRAFPQSIAMVSDPDASINRGPFARGTVTSIAPGIPNTPTVVAMVNWADGVTTQLIVTNLAIQLGNPPLSPR